MSESMPNAIRAADPLAPLRYLDVVLVVLAAPFAILLGAPALGYLVGAGVWIVSRVIEAALEATANRGDVRRAIGLKVGSMIGRVWIIGAAVLAVGLAADREDGFTAALVCLVAYTVHLATAMILRPRERNPNQT
jgi:hypothetical protein